VRLKISVLSRQPSLNPPATKIQLRQTAAPKPRRDVRKGGPTFHVEAARSRISTVPKADLPSKPPMAKTKLGSSKSWSKKLKLAMVKARAVC